MDTMKVTALLQKTALAVAIASASTTLQAADIYGSVSNSDERVMLTGAEVTLKALGRKAITGRDGRFQFNNLPAGEYTLTVRYLGTATSTFTLNVAEDDVLQRNFAMNSGVEVEQIVVYGQRSQIASSLNQQRNANKVSSVVYADAIGQFPDQNAAEALQRIPGLFIQRDQGEGRFVGIRGIDPNLNNVTINGVNVPSPEAGVRSVALDVIPSELIQGLEVSKTVTPDMDAGAIGGSIEVKSLSALDRKGRTYTLTAQASHNELVGETSPKLSGSITDVIELDDEKRLGVAAAFSWFEREFGSDNIETGGSWVELELEDAVSGDDVEGFGPEEIEQRAYAITRERTGLALNLDYQHSLQHQYYLRTMYSQFSDDEYRLNNTYKFEDGKINSDSWTATSGSVIDAEMARETKDRYEEQTILSVVAGAEHFWDDWTLEYSAGFSQSEESEPNRIDASFVGEEIAMAYVAAQVPQLQQDAAAHDLSAFEMDEVALITANSQDEELSLRVDLARAFALAGGEAEAQWGLKYRDRQKDARANEAIYDGGFDDVSGATFAVDEPRWGLGDFGPGLDRAAIRAYVLGNLDNLELNENDSEVESQGQSYTSEETISAAYAMLTWHIANWEVVAGARYEETSFSTAGNRVLLDVNEVTDAETVTTTPWMVEKDYSHFLPSINAKYNINDNLLVRLAYTNTIARPTFEDSAAYQLIEAETSEDDGNVEVERNAEVGNPLLEAYKSSNYDVTFEYYPGDIGVFSAAYFLKQLDNFIIQTQVQDNGEWDGFDEVIQPVNAGQGDIEGIELAWTKGFDSGLLVALNTTLSNASDTLPSQSDTVANATLGYENDAWSARVTANHKSNAFLFEENDARVYQDDHTQYDFNVKYNINDKLRVYFNAVNLTDEPYYVYHGAKTYNYQYEEYGRTYELGLTFSSF